MHVENIVAVDQPGVLRAIEQDVKQHEVEIGDARLRERRDIGNVFHVALADIVAQIAPLGGHWGADLYAPTVDLESRLWPRRRPADKV